MAVPHMMCVCACVRERERERVCCVCAFVCVFVCAAFHVRDLQTRQKKDAHMQKETYKHAEMGRHGGRLGAAHELLGHGAEFLAHYCILVYQQVRHLVCVCVCVCVCKYVRICIHVYTYVYVCVLYTRVIYTKFLAHH